MTQRQRLIHELEQRSNDDQMAIVNGIRSYSGDLEDLEWLQMEDLSEWLTGWTNRLDPDHVNDLIAAARNGQFDERDDYWRLDDYGSPVSSEYGGYNYGELEDIADYILANAADLEQWDLYDDLHDWIRDLTDANDEDEDDAENNDEDDDIMTYDAVRATLADWFAEVGLDVSPERLKVRATRCTLQAAPMDPADVRAWAEAEIPI